jgi:uncharacterized membrane protein
MGFWSQFPSFVQLYCGIVYGWPMVTTLAIAMAMPVILIGGITVLFVYQSRKGIHQNQGGLSADERYWKAGGTYYNPGDPALFVDKRYGVGWTLNMARPLSWVMLGGILLIPLAIVVITAIAT